MKKSEKKRKFLSFFFSYNLFNETYNFILSLLEGW